MKITLVRHTSVDVADGICYGRTDVLLRVSFPEEASLTLKSLKAMSNGHAQYDGVYSSPLSRCRRLAAFCGYEDAVSDDALLELDFGNWEMTPFDEIDDPRLNEWFKDWFFIAPTGGEPMAAQVERVRAFLDKKAEEGKKNILVFTHAGVILSALLITGNASRENLFDQKPPYGGIVMLEYPS